MRLSRKQRKSMRKLVLLLLLLAGNIYAKVVVTTTIYPLYSVVQKVGGDKVKLNNLIPFGTEPHTFEPTPQNIVTLLKSDLFITSSPVMEPWATKIIKANNLEKITTDMSKYVKIKKHKSFEEGKAFDPHYWLSFDNYIKMIKEVRALLIAKDVTNSNTYKKNAKTYIEKIKALQKQYEALKTCKNKKVIVNHDAFGYLSDDYDIKQYAIAGMSPDEQPSARQIAELIDIVKKENIHTVFFEEFANDKISKTIAKETGAKSEELSSAGNISKEAHRKNVKFLDIMRKNLVKLKKAMDCQ